MMIRMRNGEDPGTINMTVNWDSENGDVVGLANISIQEAIQVLQFVQLAQTVGRG